MEEEAEMMRAPQPPAPQRPGGSVSYTGQSTVQKPQYIDINTTEDQVNNTIATGLQNGDQRYQMKKLDRSGFSRGRGQQYMAAQEGQQSIGQAAGEAAALRSQDQATNAKMRSDYQTATEQEAMASAMAAHARSQSDWSVKFSKQQSAIDLLMQSLLST